MSVTVERCPWCEGEDWTLKTKHGEFRVVCDKCNAGFRPEDLYETIQSRGFTHD